MKIHKHIQKKNYKNLESIWDREEIKQVKKVCKETGKIVALKKQKKTKEKTRKKKRSTLLNAAYLKNKT